MNVNDINEIKISEVMTKNVIVASPNNTLAQLAQFFAEKMVNHIPVVDNNKLVGIISIKDVLRELYKGVFVDNLSKETLESKIKASDVMTKDPIVADVNSTVLNAKELFGKSKFSSLPIMDGDKLVGIITPKDLMKMRIIKIDGSDYGGY